MSNKSLSFAAIIFLPIIVLLCMKIWSLQRPIQRQSCDSETGVYDLRDIDFSQTLVNVTRTVEYVPNVLLTPEEFSMRDDIQIGTVPEDVIVSTMRIYLLVPEDIIYGLCGFSVNYASSIYVNGKWLTDDGITGTSSSEEIANETYHLFSAEPQDGVIEIVVATSSFSYKETSLGMEWNIGEYQKIRTHYFYYITVEIVMMAWYFMMALIFFLLFLTFPKYSATGWLMILALVFSLRTGLVGTKPLLTLIPAFNWAIGYRIEMLSNTLSAILLMFVFQSIFPNAIPKWLQYLLMGIAGIEGIIVLSLPTITLSQNITAIVVVAYFVLVSMVICIILSLRKNSPSLPQLIVLIGIGLILFAAIWDISYYGKNRIGAYYSIMQPMIITFFLFLLTSATLTTIDRTSNAEKEASKLRINVLEQEAEMLKTRTAIMISQIQPHFLFNVLSSINCLCEDTPDAQMAISTFAEYLRSNMDSLSQSGLVSFHQELDHVQHYVSLEELRFQEQLQVLYDIKSTDFMLPVLTIQPIVENAVRYGVASQGKVGTIVIRTEETDSSYLITITDDGIGFDQSQPFDDGRSHTGIENVRSRLNIMCNGNLFIHSSVGKGTTAIIDIPKAEKS